MINKELTDYLLNNFKDLSYSRQVGKLFADKSYGFDTMFFCCRFITRFKENNIFDKSVNLERSNKYIIDVFNLEATNAGVPNYFREALNLLCFIGALENQGDDKYAIVNQDLLDIYCSNMENAYIAQYMLAYCVFTNDNIWKHFVKFTLADSIDAKKTEYNKIISAISLKATNIGDWILFVAKFSTNILSYANRNNMVARTGNVKKDIVKITDVAINVTGKRNSYGIPKKNSYLDDMSDPYILQTLEPYLVRKPGYYDNITLSDGFAADLADTKMDILDKDSTSAEGKRHIKENKYTLAITKARTVQDEFKKSLLRATPHKCPVCGFDFEKMLTASHIMPYSKCEMTEDAMNPNNGLLMCPVCDRLFESENGLYMTIDSNDGHIRYVDEIQDVKWFKYIQGVRIDEEYLTKDRKMFLKWHNETFISKHKDEIIHDSAGTPHLPKTYDLSLNNHIGMVADGSADRENDNDE